MTDSILHAKVNLPPLPTDLVARPQVSKALDAELTAVCGFTRPLTLISAPAGAGKTTLAGQWLSDRRDQTAWYSIDEADNDPQRFWTYLISALRVRINDTGRGSREMLRSGVPLSGPDDFETVLTPLLNDLFTLSDPLYLVLDDYHLIDDSDVHEGMIFFVENAPPHLHLIVTTRSDPPWPLSRWRGRGAMGEIRLRDLQFTREESAELFFRVGGVQLDDAQIALLHERVQGWAAGLRLAAFSISENEDADRFISTFAGSHRHVFHFLSDEVLQLQPPSVQKFLMQTSILDRFNPALCNAVTDRQDSSEILAQLERDNVFLISLDNQENWYRYHPLFSDLLKHRLRTLHPEKLPTLYDRAADWCLQIGEPGEAIRYTLKGGNNDRLATLMQEHLYAILKAEGPALLIRCLDVLPPQLLARHPELVANRAYFHLIHRGMQEAKEYLDLAEELIQPDGEENLTGILAAVKTYYHIYTNDLSRAVQSATRALDLLPKDNHYWRMNIAVYSGDARLFSGDPAGAHPYYREAYAISTRTSNHYVSLSTGFKVATSHYYMGRLKRAEDLVKDLLQLATEKGLAEVTRVGLLWTLRGEIMRERGLLKEAEIYIDRGLSISAPEKPSLAWNYLFKVALAHSQGNYERAMSVLDALEELHAEVHLPAFITARANIWKARLMLEQGRFPDARQILDDAGMGRCQPEDGWDRVRLLLAQIDLAENATAHEDLSAILEQIREAATRRQHFRLHLEATLAAAAAYEATGKHCAAETVLLRALQTGKDAGYVQVFRDAQHDPATIVRRMRRCSDDGSVADRATADAVAYAKRIGLWNCAGPPTDCDDMREYAQPRGSHGRLVEDLTPREMEILQLLTDGSSNREIADELYLSIGTVKWHTSNIYGKLGVRNRTEAASQARKLQILR